MVTLLLTVNGKMVISLWDHASQVIDVQDEVPLVVVLSPEQEEQVRECAHLARLKEEYDRANRRAESPNPS